LFRQEINGGRMKEEDKHLPRKLQELSALYEISRALEHIARLAPEGTER